VVEKPPKKVNAEFNHIQQKQVEKRQVKLQVIATEHALASNTRVKKAAWTAATQPQKRSLQIS
jgi:hypothetical protein